MTVEKEFGTDPDLKKLYQVYVAIIVMAGFLWWMIPVAAFVMLSLETSVGVVISLSLFAPIIIAAGVTLYWIPRFQRSIAYVLEDDKITVTKGLWWKEKNVVPYNRITNINIYQGPISRGFGLAKLSLQTAGFSGVSGGKGKIAEAEIIGVKNFEEIKDVVLGFVRGMKPVAVEAEAEVWPSKDMNRQVLQELRRIREALEK